MNIELLSKWGNDLTVVNNARVSFDKESQYEWVCIDHGKDCEQSSQCIHKPQLKKADEQIIQFLARGCRSGDWQGIINNLAFLPNDTGQIEDILNYVRKMPDHWAPFANGVGARFRITAPVPIMRQIFKHKVGSVESEVSRRYISTKPEIFWPDFRYAPAEDIKQGSGAVLEGHEAMEANMTYEYAVNAAVEAYNHLIDNVGVCPEQARFVLPQGVMTTAIISNSLYGWANMYNQRQDRKHAQHEVAEVAHQIACLIQPAFPASWDALTK